jgi:hypothetical protein
MFVYSEIQILKLSGMVVQHLMFMTNLDNEVDCFSVNGITNSSDAIWEAREWIDNLYKEMGGHNV